MPETFVPVFEHARDRFDVRDGDRIRVNCAARRLDLLIPEAEMHQRRTELHHAPPPARGYARLWADHVLQADQGFDFDFLRAEAAS